MHNVHRVVTRIQGEIVFLTHTVKAVNTICHPLNPLVVVLIERIHRHICYTDTEVYPILNDLWIRMRVYMEVI